MTFHIITIFPESIKSYFDSSILARAQEKGLINVKFYNPRDFTEDRHKKVDDSPFGGGAGMVFKLEPIIKTIEHILNSKFEARNSKQIQNSKLKIQNETHPSPPLSGGGAGTSLDKGRLGGVKVVLFAPSGKQFTQTIAKKIAKEDGDVIFVCGRYEGIDARLKKVLRGLFSSRKIPNTNYKILEVSIGPYVLTGGELPAAVIVDAISRHIQGVLGRNESLEDERGVGIPAYTRPEVFEYSDFVSPNMIKGKSKGGKTIAKSKKYRVPKVLISGDHKKIEKWKAERGEVWE